MTPDPRRYLGVGLYTLQGAARLLAAPVSTLRYWVGAAPHAEPLVPCRFSAEHLLTFAELIELHFVKLFKDHQVSLSVIRKAAKKFGADYPFTVRQFDTDGSAIFATLKSKETEKELIEDLQQGQLVFTKIIRPFFKKLDYRTNNQEVERFWPLQKRGRIVLDPRRRFGAPIDAPTGVPTQAIVNALSAGGGQDPPEVAKWFDIPSEAVKAAVRFEQSLAS